MIQDPVLLNDWHVVLPLAQLEAQNNVVRCPPLGRGHRDLEKRRPGPRLERPLRPSRHPAILGRGAGRQHAAMPLSWLDL